MIKPEEEVIIDVSTSCTKDEAVAKLLGWSRGPIFPRRIQITEYGIERLDLEKLSTFDMGVQAQLEQIHLSAQSRLLKAAEGDWTPEQLKSLEDEIYKCRELVLQASDFFLAIDDELSKGESSELRIHGESTEATGITHITIGSLENWGLTQHQVDIRPPHRQVKKVPKHELMDAPATDTVTEKEGPKYSRLLVTFAFLIDAFIERDASKYKRPDGSVNTKNLAEELSKRAALSNKGDKLQFQSVEAIKDRIEDSQRARKEALPAK